MWHFFPGPDAALGFVLCFFKGCHEETLGRGRDSVLQCREGSCSAASGKCCAVRTLNCTFWQQVQWIQLVSGGERVGQVAGRTASLLAGISQLVRQDAWSPLRRPGGPAPAPPALQQVPTLAPTHASRVLRRVPAPAAGAPGARAGLDGETEAALCWACSRKGGQPARMWQQNERKEKVLSRAEC